MDRVVEDGRAAVEGRNDAAATAGGPAGAANDVTVRPEIWRRFDGDDWAAFDALPRRVRERLHEHAYDAWSVNALMLWRSFRRKHASSARGETTLLRYLDQCESMERAEYDARHRSRYGETLPHVAAAATVLRYCGRPVRYADAG